MPPAVPTNKLTTQTGLAGYNKYVRKQPTVPPVSPGECMKVETVLLRKVG